MARQNRIEIRNGIYHVINRGNYRSWIFQTEGAKLSFESALFEACERYHWTLSAYCILSNHFHLCLGTPNGGLSEGMRWLQGTFATRFNRLRKENGHCFQGRFKSPVVQPGHHWVEVVNYIHLNPLHAGHESETGIGEYRWSSLYFWPKRKRRAPCFDTRWMDYTDMVRDSPSGWRKYKASLHLRAAQTGEEKDRLEKKMNLGWCLGDREFKKELVKDYLEQNGFVYQEKAELAEWNEMQWESYLDLALERLGIAVDAVWKSKFSEPWKLAIASKMKRETSATNSWLSRNLNMGNPKAVSANCGKYIRDRQPRCPFAKLLENMKYEH